MKRTVSIIITLVLSVSSAFAEPACGLDSDRNTCNQHAVVTTLGLWALCKAMPQFQLCDSVKPGDAQYILSLIATNQGVTNFKYTVTGTVGGEPWTMTGTVDVAQQGVVTSVDLKTGGEFDTAPDVTIVERVDSARRSDNFSPRPASFNK